MLSSPQRETLCPFVVTPLAPHRPPPWQPLLVLAGRTVTHARAMRECKVRKYLLPLLPPLQRNRWSLMCPCVQTCLWVHTCLALAVRVPVMCLCGWTFFHVICCEHLSVSERVSWPRSYAGGFPSVRGAVYFPIPTVNGHLFGWFPVFCGNSWRCPNLARVPGRILASERPRGGTRGSRFYVLTPRAPEKAGNI